MESDADLLAKAKKLDDVLVGSAEKSEKMVDLCKLLADEVRFITYWKICQQPRTVEKLAKEIGVTQPALSHHLKILLDNGVVTKQRQGQFVCYSISDSNPIERMNAWLLAISCNAEDKITQPKKRTDISKNQKVKKEAEVDVEEDLNNVFIGVQQKIDVRLLSAWYKNWKIKNKEVVKIWLIEKGWTVERCIAVILFRLSKS